MPRRSSKVVPGLVRQCERQALDATLSVSSEAAIEPYAPAAPRNKCLGIQQPGFPKKVIINGRKYLLIPFNERVSPAAGPMGVGRPNIFFGHQIIKYHNTPQ